MSTPARAPGRPLDATIAAELLTATQDLLIEQGYERLTMDAVARRCGASKATIYRRWPSKTALVVAAVAALYRVPEVPDLQDLREDLIACGRAFVHGEGRDVRVLASVLSAARHDAELRDASRQGVGAPFSALFASVLSRAVARGEVAPDVDVPILAQVLPAIAYERLATRGELLTDDEVVRVVDGVLLPAVRSS